MENGSLHKERAEKIDTLTKTDMTGKNSNVKCKSSTRNVKETGQMHHKIHTFKKTMTE